MQTNVRKILVDKKAQIYTNNFSHLIKEAATTDKMFHGNKAIQGSCNVVFITCGRV